MFLNSWLDMIKLNIKTMDNYDYVALTNESFDEVLIFLGPLKSGRKVLLHCLH